MSASETVAAGLPDIDAVLVYATFPDRAGALQAARGLLEDRLIACANILPGMTSLYRWNGVVETAEEVVLILKTVEANVDRLVEAVRSVHPYDVPAIVALPVVGGSEPFLRWITDESRPD